MISFVNNLKENLALRSPVFLSVFFIFKINEGNKKIASCPRLKAKYIFRFYIKTLYAQLKFKIPTKTRNIIKYLVIMKNIFCNHILDNL